jgi:hypothetical protein
MRDVPLSPKNLGRLRRGGNPGRNGSSLCELGQPQGERPSFRLGLNGAHGPAAHTEEKEPLAPNPNDRCADEPHRLAATLTFHAWSGVLLDGGGL